MDFNTFYFIIVALFSDGKVDNKVKYYTVNNEEKVYVLCSDKKYTEIKLKSLD